MILSGEVWRRMRRAAHEGMNKAVASRYHPIQTTEAVALCQGLLRDADSWDDHFRRWDSPKSTSAISQSEISYFLRAAASSVMSITYGSPMLESVEDPAIKKVNDFVERIVKAAYPGAHLVE